MKRTTMLCAMAVVSTAVGAASACPGPVFAQGPVNRGDAVVYVRSQGLYYDSIVLNDLPPKGKFQLLEMGPNGLETDFGPGDPGYRGGRWMEDFNGDGQFHYFLCPLLPPGRENP